MSTGRLWVLGGAVSLLFALGCKTTYYATMEKFGVHKRDILKDNVQEARDEQAKAAEQFKDALTRLRELYNINGGDLEKTYDRLKADFDKSEARANAVKERIAKVETVANDLFVEWDKEIQQMENSALASQSRDKLRTTREKYQSLHASMKQAETSMDPVLKQFRDQVLYLKHNLNAQAVASLRGEAVDVEQEIQKLITEMNNSIKQADEFIRGLE